MNILQRYFNRMTVKKVAGIQYFIFEHEDREGADIYDQNFNYYGCWSDSETFLKRTRAGEKLMLVEGKP